MRLNLGAGGEIEEGMINCDWLDLPGIDKVFNLLETPWPFDDDCAEYVLARDVLEHMPNFTNDNRATPIVFLEEIHRILQVGGRAFITVPHWQSRNLWIDLTHVRGYDERSLDYFDPDTEFGRAYGYYSKCKFKVTSVRTPNDNVEFSLTKL